MSVGVGTKVSVKFKTKHYEEHILPGIVNYVEPCIFTITDGSRMQILKDTTGRNYKTQRLLEIGNSLSKDISYKERRTLIREKIEELREESLSLSNTLRTFLHLVKKLQIVNITIERDSKQYKFWFTLFDCNPQDIHDFAYTKINYDDDWNELQKIHNKGFLYSPGTMTSIHCWITQGSLSYYLYDKEKLREFLSHPLIFGNHPDMITELFAQYDKDIVNLQNIAKPLGIDTIVYRAQDTYKNIHKNIHRTSVTATTNNYKQTANFRKSASNVKQILIPADKPVIDLRLWNPEEREILLLPPVWFEVVKLGPNVKTGKNNLNHYKLRGGTRKRRQKRFNN
jgi:hypothetical protein